MSFTAQDDLLELYLNHLRVIPRLSRERELELACQLVEARSQLTERSRGATAGESDRITCHLHRIIERSRRDLIQGNLRLVIPFAKRLKDRGLTMLDLIQEGNIGLVRAVDKYDPSRGTKLSTCAAAWIHLSMVRAIAETSRTVRLPLRVVEKLTALSRYTHKLTGELSRPPSTEEIAAAMSEGDVRTTTAAKVRSLQTLERNASSLDERPGIRFGINSSMTDFVIDETALNGLEACLHLERRQLTRQLVSASLPDREQRIIERRFGLDGNPSEPRLDVGKRLGLGRERTRQLEMKALTQLRDRARAIGLSGTRASA